MTGTPLIPLIDKNYDMRVLLNSEFRKLSQQFVIELKASLESRTASDKLYKGVWEPFTNVRVVSK
jgi:hypothetical protein